MIYALKAPSMRHVKQPVQAGCKHKQSSQRTFVQSMAFSQRKTGLDAPARAMVAGENNTMVYKCCMHHRPCETIPIQVLQPCGWPLWPMLPMRRHAPTLQWHPMACNTVMKWSAQAPPPLLVLSSSMEQGVACCCCCTQTDDRCAPNTHRAHYTGRLASTGTKFDSSYDRGRPLSFKVCCCHGMCDNLFSGCCGYTNKHKSYNNALHCSMYNVYATMHNHATHMQDKQECLFFSYVHKHMYRLG